MRKKHGFSVTAATALLAVTLSGCGTTNNFLAEKNKVVEYYRIYDIKTTAPFSAVVKAASDGLGRNINNANEATPIPTSNEIPDKAGRFKLMNPLANSQFAALASLANGAGGIGMKMATCEDAVWTAKAVRDISGSSNLQLTLCLFKYKEGYHLDMYGVFSKQEGGLFQISREMAYAAVGTPEEWTEKTFLDVPRSIHAKTSADISLLEAIPEVNGTPWLDAYDGKR